MIHKLCENHLVELYQAIKAGEIVEVERIEHELTPAEECVACAYALKAQGEVKDVLLEYLQSEGFIVDTTFRRGALATVWFFFVRILPSLAAFWAIVIGLGENLPLPFNFIAAFAGFVVIFAITDQLLTK